MKWLNIRYNRYKNKSNDDVDDGQRSSSSTSSTSTSTSTSARLSPKQRKSIPDDNYNNQFKSPLTTSTLSMKKSSSSSTAAISTSTTTMVKNKISLVHHHKHHHRKQIYKNNNNNQNNENNNNDKQQLQPLSLQSYYTNSPWINKQQQQNFFDNNNNNNNNKSINFYKNLSSNTTLLLKQNNNHYYNQQCINYKRNYNDNILDILSDNRRSSSSSSSSSSSTLLNPIDSTTNLIHNSIMYYVNQIRPIDQSDHQKSQQQQQNRRRFYEKPKAPPEPLNGTCITPFEVLIHGYLLHRIVGRGSFSTLYEASRLFVSHGGVACKHVRIGRPEDICLTDSDGRWRLQMQQYFLEEEIRILRQIRHPNIIQLYEIIIDDDNRNYYIMMKFAVNKTIANYLYQFYQKPLPETYAKRWTRQLMLAIQYLHEECRIAHRDLKLENFLLDEKYVALLTDFGLAISLSIHSSSSASLNRNSPNHHHHHYMIDNNSYLKKFFDKNFVDQNQNHRTKRIETLLSIQCGTTEYMAPEILNQELQQQQQQQQMTAATTTLFNDTFPWCSYDPFRADIYSMGICLFEMLNYYRPFRWSSYNINYINGGGAFGSYNQNHNNNNLVWQQRNRQYRYNKRIYLTEECRDLIDEMLEPRAAIRPTSRQVLDHRWFKYSIR